MLGDIRAVQHLIRSTSQSLCSENLKGKPRVNPEKSAHTIFSLKSKSAWSSLLLRHGFWDLALTSLVVGRGAGFSSYFRIPGSRSSLPCYCSLFLAGGYGSLRAEFHFTGYRCRLEFFLLLSPRDGAGSVLTARTKCSVAGHCGPAVWVFSFSGFHHFFATMPVSSETNKADHWSNVATMVLSGTRGP